MIMMLRQTNSDKSWNSTDEEFDECDNSSLANDSNNRRISGDEMPGGIVTTHSVSSAIRPGSKLPRTDPLQFVKISNNELCKKAVEQIKLAEEVKITKEKIKEVEEEWQNNLLNWKSKRRLSKNNSDDSGSSSSAIRKTKTFNEILNEKAKSGHLIGYNLRKYIEGDDDDDNELKFDFENNNNNNNGSNNKDDSEINDFRRSNGLGDVIVFDTAFLEEFSYNHHQKNYQRQESESSTMSEANEKGDMNRDKCITTDNGICDNDKNLETEKSSKSQSSPKLKQKPYRNDSVKSDKNDIKSDSINSKDIQKTQIEIKDWKINDSDNHENVLQYLLKHEQNHHDNVENFRGSEYDRNDDESDDEDDDDEDDDELSHHNSFDGEEDDEEVIRLRLEQEKSFKAKLSAFENLAKAEETPQQIKTKPYHHSREELNKKPPAVEQLIQNEHLNNKPNQRPQYYDNDNEEHVNARIQQLHLERQRVQQQHVQQQHVQQQHVQQQHVQQQHAQQQHVQQHVQPKQVQQQTVHPQQHVQQPQVLEEQQNLIQQKLFPQQTQRHFDQQQYYLIDDIESNQKNQQQIMKQTNSSQSQHPQEHLYVNQKQLLMQKAHPQFYEQLESQSRQLEYDYESALPHSQSQGKRDVYDYDYEHTQQPIYAHTSAQTHNQQYLYYPKPYAPNKQPQQSNVQKPVIKTPPQQPIQRQSVQSPTKSSKPQPSGGYNRNHWLVQEAELRRQLATIPSQVTAAVHPQPQPPPVQQRQSQMPVPSQATQLPAPPATKPKPSIAPLPKGMLSVSGRKKCSNCGDELGRGCAAMVVESLSLYYHINCFRCSVCHLQLGNGTVGTDVRVRNHKLHCQNCYSNDEAGLKFSRV